MGTSLRVAASVGRLLQSSRKRRGMTLREVSAACEKRGERIPPSTLARIEQGKLDPGAWRLHLLLRLYNVPSHLVGDLIELEALAVEPPLEDDLETVFENGIRFWREGDIGRGLAHLMAVREYVPDTPEAKELRQRATVAFGSFARDLGKIRLAKNMVDDLLCEPPVPSLRTRTMVLAASVWRALGSLDSALAYVHRAAEAGDALSPQDRALVHHQTAKLELEAGERASAGRHLKRALDAYRECDDSYGTCRAMLLKIGWLEAGGKIERAIAVAREVLALAEEHGHERILAGAHVELGRVLLANGDEEEGLAAVREGLSVAVRLEDRNSEFHAHYHLWKAYSAMGDTDRARFEFEAARYFVDSVDDLSPETDAMRRMLEEGDAT